MNQQPTFLYRPLFLASGSFGLLSLLLPIYARELGASATAIGGLFAIFTGTVLLLRPVAGWALDSYGRRPFLLLAFSCYIAAMLCFAAGTELIGLYFARFLQGTGSAVMWLAMRTVVGDTVEESGRARVMGRLTEQSVRGSMIGAFYGFTLLGFLPLASAWRWSFVGYAVLALLALVVAYRKIPETRQQIEVEPVPPWTKRLVRLALVVWTVAFAEALIGPVFLIMLSDRFEVSPDKLGAVFAGGLMYTFIPSRAGAWGDRVGRYKVLALGLLGAAVINVSFPFLPSIWLLVILYAGLAAAWSTVGPQLEALKVAETDERSRGRVLARFEVASGTGAAVGPLLGGWFYDHWNEAAPFALNGLLLLLVCFGVLVLERVNAGSLEGQTP